MTKTKSFSNVPVASRRICVVGAGRWGMNHIRTLHGLGMLAGVVEANVSTREGLREKFPEARLFANTREAVAEGFDGFTVATPAETHFPIAKFLIEEGQHVLVEKPLTLKTKDALELKRLADERNVNLMVGHLLLFHPAICKMKELIDQGKVGRLQYIYSNRLNLGAIRTEENILWSFAPHDISIFQYLIGNMPVEIVSRGGAFLQPNIHDSSMTVLTYPNNIVGHIFVNWLHPFKEHRLVVVGSKGMFSYEDSSDDQSLLFYEKGIDWIQGEPIKHDGPTEVIPYENKMPLAEELLYFAEHLDGRPIRTADAQNGIDVLEILEKATESLLLQDSGIRNKGLKGKDKIKGSEMVPNTSINDRALLPNVHESAVIDEDCQIGNDTKIWHFSHILSGSSIGENCNIGQNVVIGPDVKIGANCKIQNNVSVYKGVTLEEGVFCGPSMVFTNVYNPRAEIRKMDAARPTLVKRGATIGANATIVCGNTIGSYALVGAGAVVVDDVSDHALVVGNPAKQVGWVCSCGERLDDDMKCVVCGTEYKEELVS